MAALQILDQVTETTDSLIESISEVQTTIYTLHTTVNDLLTSMSDMLKSMSEFKETLSESQLPLEHNLPESLEEKPIFVDNAKVEIEMPIFEGSNVYLWISKAERYFENGNFTESEKIRLVYCTVDGEGLNWFNFWKVRKPFLNWNDLKSRILDRFGEELRSGSVIERVLRVKQVGSVVFYLREFEEVASLLCEGDGGSDEFLEAVFLSGLKEEISNTVRLFKASGGVKGISDVINMALRVENSLFCKQPLDHDSCLLLRNEHDDDDDDDDDAKKKLFSKETT